MTISWLYGRQCWRLFYFLVSICLVLLSVSYTQAQTPATTLVNDIVYRADGTPAGGTLLISWPAFTSADQKPVAAGTMSATIGSGGRVNLNLVPNQGATPTGTYYKVVLEAGRRHHYDRVLERAFILADDHCGSSFEHRAGIGCGADGLATIPRFQSYDEGKRRRGDS